MRRIIRVESYRVVNDVDDNASAYQTGMRKNALNPTSTLSRDNYTQCPNDFSPLRLLRPFLIILGKNPEIGYR